MLEMKVFRENSKAIFGDLKKRNMVDDNAKEVIQNDQKWRELIDEGNKLRAQRNAISKEVGELKKKGGDASELLQKMSDVKKRLSDNESDTESYKQPKCLLRVKEYGSLEQTLAEGGFL